MDIKRVALACVFATASLGVMADQPSYTYVEGGYLRMDPDDISLDPTGYYLDGSIAIADNWFLRGGYSDVDDSKGGLKVEAESVDLGVGYKQGLGANSSFHLVASYLEGEVTARGYGSRAKVDDDGFALTAGLRSHVLANLELNADVSYVDVDDSGVDFGVGAVWYFVPNIGLSLNLNVDDDSNSSFGAGVRLSF
ncbi:MAG: porin family protein [Bacteroidales bacterium]|nr:porin family protein [Bacteroidales bacterium]